MLKRLYGDIGDYLCEWIPLGYTGKLSHFYRRSLRAINKHTNREHYIDIVITPLKVREGLAKGYLINDMFDIIFEREIEKLLLTNDERNLEIVIDTNNTVNMKEI